MELYYLMSITDRDRAEDMAALYRDAGLNLVTTMMGRGTATPQQLALYGLSRTEKAVTGAVVVAFDVTEQALAQRNRREFTANVSHELKTPLQSIMGSAELMQNGLVKPEDMPVLSRPCCTADVRPGSCGTSS